MRKVQKKVQQVGNWLRFFWKGLSVLPGYYRHWGFAFATRRALKALIMPGLVQMMNELNTFLESQASRVKVIRRPDYVIVAPDFVSYSAGIACLYRLCTDLRERGFEAAITGSQVGRPGFPVPLISHSEALHAAKEGAWVVYPEIIDGNPLKGKNVIRWVLNRPGLLGGEEVYSESEHIFVYSDVFAPYVRNKIAGKLYMPTIDRSLFFAPSKQTERSEVSYYVGKSRYKEGYVNPRLAFEITRMTPPKSELGKIFRQSKVLYCFDNSTALIYEALLCGCPVVIIPDGTQTWEDYEKLELGTAGIYWGREPDDVKEFVPTELDKRLREWEHQYNHQLTAMVDYTQKVAKTCPEAFHLGVRLNPSTEELTTPANKEFLV